MAKENAKRPAGAKSNTVSDAEQAPKAARPRAKSRLLLLAVTFLLLTVGAGGGGWFYLHANAEAVEPPKPPPVFVNLDTFTVNLADREHYLQMGLAYEMTGNEATDSMKVHMPILRSRILLLLAAKTAEDLGTPDGKTRLATELVDQARATLPVSGPDKGVAAVHFSAFVIQ